LRRGSAVSGPAICTRPGTLPRHFFHARDFSRACASHDKLLSVFSRLGLLIALALIIASCTERGSPLATRGRQVYMSQCTSCHSADPSQAGPVGPPLKGTSRELLETKVLRGAYPPGYKPKRPTQVMPPQPQVANDVPALAEFLR
jgi:cytochrome c553